MSNANRTPYTNANLFLHRVHQVVLHLHCILKQQGLGILYLGAIWSVELRTFWWPIIGLGLARGNDVAIVIFEIWG